MIRCHLSRYLAPLGFYQDTNFAQGNAYVVKPGDHPSLGGNNSVSSLRPLPIASEGDDGVITFFEDTNYCGNMVVLTSSCPSLRLKLALTTRPALWLLSKAPGQSMWILVTMEMLELSHLEPIMLIWVPMMLYLPQNSTDLRNFENIMN